MTVCAKCKWLSDSAKSLPWYRWYCMARPMPDEINPVTGDGPDPPYALCRYTNVGDCPLFEAGPNVLNPNPMPQPSTEGQQVA